MPNVKQICLALVLACAMCSIAAAQDSSSSNQRSTLTITANATGERVRITAPSSIVQLHVEVYAASGEKLFDQEIRGGNVFDWHLQDGQAQRLAPGAYVCVVTAKSVSGKITQKIGAVTVAEKSASVQLAGSPQLSLQQTQAIGPVEADSSWTIAGENEPQTPTVIANDGTDGQMIRGRGALTFRVGNFFSGVDTEQMRLTEAGDVGIGTSQPQSKLDVAGTIRAERFLVVKPNPGNGDKTAATQASDAVDGVQPLVAGTGTQNQIAKWTDNAGTLGDSVITEAATGRVGVGITIPLSKFHVSSNFDALRLTSTNDTTPVWAQFNTSLGSGLGYFGVEGNTAGTFLAGTLPYAAALSSGGSGTALQLGSAGSVKMTILSGGNVGIGTTAPGAKLDVAGTVNSSAQYNIRGDRVLTIDGDEKRNTFVGYHAGRTTLPISGINNSFFGFAAGLNNNSGDSNTFLGALAGDLNNSGSFNTFVGVSTGGDVVPGAGDYITLLGYSAGFGLATNLDHATAIGAGAFVDSSNTIVLGRPTGDDTVIIPGKLQIDTLAASGSTELCLNSNNRVGPCSASSLRYKKAVLPFAAGLSIINRLQPIAFTWKDDGLRDLGLAAEDVAVVEPMLTFKNKEGEIEGVKYNRVNLVLINAVKEQQQQIAALQTRLRRLEQTLKRRHR